jgi:oxygen-independent coproporphyrinogen-3 oxidase
MTLTTPPAFGVYIHWPFCLSKCPYCDFNSHVRHGGIDEARYVAAFLREMQTIAQRTGKREVTTVFFGGGTPSLMKPETVSALLDGVAKYWSVAPGVEVTLEANPTSVEAERFRGFRAAGVNRVSLYSFDLIYARPHQTPAQWAGELKRAIAEAAEHLSLYQLTIEADTPFFALHANGKLVTPDEDTARAFYDTTQEICDAAGLSAYEISNHARSGAECRHNLVYWRGDDYAGIGPGAHGRIVENGRRVATATEKRPESWLMRVESLGHGLVVDEALNREERADEYLLMGLRLAEGIDPKRFEEIAGRPLDEARIRILRAEGAVETTKNGYLRVTQAAFPILDAVVADLAA